MKTLLSLTVCSALLLTGSAFAADHDHQAQAKPAAKAATAAQASDPAFAKLDANADGFISKSELPAKHPLIGHFGMLDKNKDKKLDPQEFKAAKGML